MFHSLIDNAKKRRQPGNADSKRAMRLRVGALQPWALGLRLAEVTLGAGLVLVMLQVALTLTAPVPLPHIPAAEPTSAPDFQVTSSSAGNHPFGLGPFAGNLQDAAPLKESALNLKLYGTWLGADGGAAIISLDGAPQKKVAVGEEIAAGVRLESVRDDYVVISNQGIREAAAIVNRRVAIETIGEQPAENEILDTPPSGISLRDAPASDELRQGAVLPDLATFEPRDAKDAADAISPDETD